MAKTFTLQSKSYDGRSLKLTCTQTQDISANQSVISWVLESMGGSSNYYYTGPTTLTVNGTQVYYSARTGAHEFPCAKGSTSGSLTVSHAADGKKSVDISLKTAIYTKTATEKSDEWTLDTIPRQATIMEAPDFTDEENPTVSYTNPAGTGVTSLDLCIALDAKLTKALAYQAVSKTETTFTYPLTEADREFFRREMPDTNTLDVCFCLRTVIGGQTYFDKQWRQVRIVNANPIIQPQLSEADDKVLQAAPGAYLRNLSDVAFSVGAQGQKGATIVSQSVQCGGNTVEAAEGILRNIESGELLFTATDSRGNTTALPVQLPFVAYVKPTCSIGSTQPGTDGNFALTASGVCYTGALPHLGDNGNYLYAHYCYKESGGDYTDWMPMTVTCEDNSYTATADITGLDYRTTYIFLCKAGDCITETTSDPVVVKAMPVFDWGEEDFNFNVPVAAPALTLDGVQMDYITEQGTKDGWLYRKWQSGMAECWYRKEHAAAISEPWGNLYAATSPTGRTAYPFAFAEKPFETVTVKSSVPAVFAACSSGGLGDNTLWETASYNAIRPTPVTDGHSVYFVYYVVGRWK